MNTKGRPRKFDRDDAIRIMMNEIWMHGAPSVTVMSASKKLGITRSSFYHAFGSLEGLFQEALELYMDELASMAQSASSQEPDSKAQPSPTKVLRSFFRVLCKSRASDPLHRGCLVVNGMGELNTLEMPMQNLILEKNQLAIDEYTQILKLAVKQGELPKGTKVTTIAGSLHMLAIGINTLSKTIHSEQKLWSMADSTLTGLGV